MRKANDTVVVGNSCVPVSSRDLLPSDLWRKVFHHLRLEDLVGLPCTCKQFAEVTSAGQLYEAVTLSLGALKSRYPHLVTQQRLPKLIHQLASVQELTLQDTVRPFKDRTLLQALFVPPLAKTLLRVSLQRCKAEIVPLLLALKSLEALELYVSTAVSSEIQAFDMGQLSQLEHLRHLMLRLPPTAQLIPSYLDRLSQLTGLRLVNWPDALDCNTMSFVSNMPALKSLAMQGYKGQTIPDNLSRNLRLTRLDIGFAGVPYDQLASLYVLSTLTALHVLHLYGSRAQLDVPSLCVLRCYASSCSISLRLANFRRQGSIKDVWHDVTAVKAGSLERRRKCHLCGGKKMTCRCVKHVVAHQH